MPCSASPNLLWPPNHELLPITVSISTNDDTGSVFVTLLAIQSNQADSGLGAQDQTLATGAPQRRGARTRHRSSGTARRRSAHRPRRAEHALALAQAAAGDTDGADGSFMRASQAYEQHQQWRQAAAVAHDWGSALRQAHRPEQALDAFSRAALYTAREWSGKPASDSELRRDTGTV